MPASENVNQISLFNLQGRKVLQTSRTNEFNISGLENGIYFLEIITDHFIATKRIIIE